MMFSFLLNSLEENDFKDVLNAMEDMHFKEEDTVVKQENPGDVLYLIYQGTFNFFKVFV